jgi:hypothetical protein
MAGWQRPYARENCDTTLFYQKLRAGCESCRDATVHANF